MSLLNKGPYILYVRKCVAAKVHDGSYRPLIPSLYGTRDMKCFFYLILLFPLAKPPFPKQSLQLKLHFRC